MPAALTITHLTKTYPSVPKPVHAIARIDLDIREGEFLVVLGPSGCGKSTLLRILSGLDRATSGTVTFGPGHTTADIGFVFQQFALLPWLTVEENIALGLIGRRVPAAVRASRVTRELERFGLTQCAASRTRALSGGMRQRVGFARALATDPKLLFLDEAFSELDSFTAEELRGELLQIWTERKPTIVMVTHLIPEAIQLADRIAVLTPRPARIERIVPVTLPRPRDKRSPAFFALEDELTALIAP